MIHNPMVVQVGGGSAAEWQELKLDGTQDVPMTRVGEPTFTFTFKLHFDQLPRAILFRTVHGGGVDYYSVLSRMWKNDFSRYQLLPYPYNAVGVKSFTVSGTTIEGTFVSSSGAAEFLPIYN